MPATGDIRRDPTATVAFGSVDSLLELHGVGRSVAA
jgi:hypothetical protein